MQNQLTRILSTSTIIPQQFLQSLQNNEYELTQLQQFQQLLSQKNNQVQQLHTLISQQLSKTIQENNRMKNFMSGVIGELKNVKQEINQMRGIVGGMGIGFGRDLKGVVGKIVEEVKYIYERKYRKQCEEFKQTYKQQHISKQKIPQKIHKIDKNIQTQKQKQASKQKQQIPIQTTQHIQQLQSQIKSLNQQKQLLQLRIKQLSQHNFIRNSISPDLYSSTNSKNSNQNFNSNYISNKNQNQKLAIVLTHFATQFSQLQQKKYTGQTINDKKHGYGKCQYSQQFVYQGRFIKGLRDGIGQMRYEDMTIYKGQWKKGKITGKGNLYFIGSQQYQNGDGCIQKYCGNFINGKIQGYGTIYYKSGQKVRGYFKDGKLIGSALIQHCQQNILEYGEFKQPNLLPQFLHNRPIEIHN